MEKVYNIILSGNQFKTQNCVYFNDKLYNNRHMKKVLKGVSKIHKSDLLDKK